VDRKIKNLKTILKKLGSVVVAYSGGVDSTFLLKLALDTLGKDKVLAVTAKSEVFPDSELKAAKRIARQLGARHIVIKTNELKNRRFVNNPVNRCYYCKKELFSRLRRMARKKKLKHVLDGTNFDDLNDLRFGRKAARELGVRSPMVEAKITKQDIRKTSRTMKLPTWDKGSFACLASRFTYGQRLKKSELMKIEKLEDFLKLRGFKQIRVRMHENIARIEVNSEDITSFIDIILRKKIINKFKQAGFTYTTLDLAGYRPGSMNEPL